MEPTRAQIDEIYREKVLRARRQSEGDRLVSAITLFQTMLAWTRADVMASAPDADEAQIEILLHQRLSRMRQISERGIYGPLQDEPRD